MASSAPRQRLTLLPSVHERVPIITVFTDGASKGNPGLGGWGATVVRPDGHVTELGGGSPHTTNNKMELTGAIEAFRTIESIAGRIAVYTDSTHVIQGIREWIHGWKRRGWRHRRTQPRSLGRARRADVGAGTARHRVALRPRPCGHAGERTGG